MAKLLLHPFPAARNMVHRPSVLWMTAVVCRFASIETLAPAMAKNHQHQGSTCSFRQTPYSRSSLGRIQVHSTTFQSNTLNRSPSNTQRWMTSDSGGSDEDDKAIQAENDAIEKKTMEWLQRVVIGMNLCPFAERPVKQGNLKIEIIRGNDEQVILSCVLAELIKRQDVAGTTLLVCPECYPNDFDEYLQVVNMIDNGLLVEHDDLAENVQVAPFHPQFCFDGASAASVDNWTNRSPYPIFHLLREDEVTKAVDLLKGDAGKVWKRNVNLLHAFEEELGAERVERVMQGQGDEDDEAKSQEILRRFKLQVGDPVDET